MRTVSAPNEAANAPTGDCHLINELTFGESSWLMDGDVFGQECLVFVGTLGLQDQRLAGRETVFEGIAG